MANFTLIRALGWAVKSKLLSSEMALIDARITKTINATEGSSHAPSAQIVIAGSGMSITPLVSDDADLKIGSGHKVDFLSGSSLVIESGAAGEVKSGGAFTAKTGSAVGLYGTTKIADGSTGGTNGTVYVGFSALGAGHLIITQYGDATVQSGGLVTVASGGQLDISGAADVKSGGVLSILSGGTLEAKSGALVKGATGSSWRLQGATKIGDGGAGGTNGKLYLGDATYGAGELLVTAFGQITIQDTGVLQGDAGSATVFTGTTGNPATVTFVGDGANTPAGAQLILTNGASFHSTSISPVSIDNLVDTTQTGPFLKSGDSAVTKLRVKTIPDTSNNVTITASEADIWEIPATVTHNPLNVSVAAESFSFEFTIVQRSANMGNPVNVQTSGGAARGTFNPATGLSDGVLGACRYRNRGGDQKPYIVAYWNGIGGSNTSDELFTPP